MSNKLIYSFVLFVGMSMNLFAMEQKFQEAKAELEIEVAIFEREQQRKITDFYEARRHSIMSGYIQNRSTMQTKLEEEQKEFESRFPHEKSLDEKYALLRRVAEIMKGGTKEEKAYDAEDDVCGKEFITQLERDKAEIDLRIKKRLEELEKVAIEEKRKQKKAYVAKLNERFALLKSLKEQKPTNEAEKFTCDKLIHHNEWIIGTMVALINEEGWLGFKGLGDPA